MTPRLWYATIYVRDFDAAVAFYEQKLGLPLSFRNDEHGYASFATGGAGLALARVGPEQAELAGRPTGIGLGVEDLQKAYEEMRERGVPFPMPPERQSWGGTIAMLADPEGNTLVLDQLRDDR